MPGKLKVQIIAARDLPVMDRASDLADAFVEVKLGQVTHKTEVCRKSLNPQWQSEWFKFEVDDEELQDEPLQLRIMDYDTYSAHDAIGKVYIDLNPLLLKDGPSEISGWLPIYDTMHGMRGEISVVVKVDLLENVSKFKESSCGVQFFSSSGIPTCYTVSAVHGFVEELVVNDDPEYQWIDMIRTPRASNEARQQLFTKLSGELQRKIGLKVLEREGNAVLGYWQCFDLEGESGIVVRGIGTAALIHKTNPMTSPLSTSPPQDQLNPKDFSAIEDAPDGSMIGSPLYTQQISQPTPRSPSKVTPCRHSSDSDLSSAHIVGSVGSQEKAGSGGSGGLSQRMSLLPKPTLPPITIDILEYPFFTIKKFPPGFLVHLGGVVTARSVKLLDRIHNPDEPETRDAWWTEIRTEIRSHAATMGCHAVVGYKETTSICDEICLLSATGTAAIVNLAAFQHAGVPLLAQPQSVLLTTSLDRPDFQQHLQQNSQEKSPPLAESIMSENPTAATESCPKCAICHIPYNESSLPFPVSISKCAICRRSKVPDVLFCTVEPPHELSYTGLGCCLQASVCRSKKKATGESNAAMISDALPFMEYEIHRQLMNKLKVKGMNALFGLRVQIIVGETLLIGVATATASYITALPPPSQLRVTSQSGGGEKQVQAIQKKLLDITARNKDIYELHLPESIWESSALDSPQPLDNTDDLAETQFQASQKDTYVLTVDDVEDKETVWGLFDPELPTGLFSCTTETVPGNFRPSKHMQMFTMMRTQTLLEASTKHFAPIFDDLVQSMCFKLRSMAPCCLCNVCYDVNVPDDDVVQLWLTASAVDLQENVTSSPEKVPQSKGSKSSDAELLFAMEELQVTERAPASPSTPTGKVSKVPKLEKRIVLKDTIATPTWLPKVEITPLSAVPGGVIDQYLGYINLFFVRESMSVRESGGVSGFMYNFISEVNAIIRSHVASLGGNALVAYNLVDCLLEDRNHQCQCLINVSGDAVHVVYDGATSSMDSPCPSQPPTSHSQQFSRDSSAETPAQIVELKV